MKGLAKHPRFKSKRRTKPSFYADTCKIRFTDTHVKLEKLTIDRRKRRRGFNFVRLAECGRIPANARCSNSRVTFDGLNRWISVGIEYASVSENPAGAGME